MKKIIVALCAGSVLWGCAPVFQGTVGYKSQTVAQKTYPATVAVPPLTDRRGNVSKNRTGLIFVPLVIYATAIDDRIEKGPAWGTKNQYGYPKGFAPAYFLQGSLAQELQQSRLFQNAVPAANEQQAQYADLVLKGELLSTRFTTKGWTYGLSAFALYSFYLFGLPTCTTAQELTLKLELLRPGSSKPLWSGMASEKMTGSAGIYYLSGMSKEYVAGINNCLNTGSSDHGGQLLNELLAKAMAKATPALANALKSQPPDFWQEIEDARAQRGAFQPQVPGQEKAVPEGPSSLQKALEEIQKQLIEE